jgi:hypothetical protein
VQSGGVQRRYDNVVAIEPSAPAIEVAALRGRQRALPHPRAVVGAIGVTALVTGVTLIVLVATSRATFLVPPDHVGFPRWLVGPLDGVLRSYDPTRSQLIDVFTATMATLFFAYLVALIGAPALRVGWIAAGVVAVHLVLALSPPLSLTDVFNYLNYGHMGALHHLNPYTTIPAAEPTGDPTFALSNWHHLRDPYGPLFTLGTYALAQLSVPAAFWMLKLITVAASLGTVWIVYRAALHLGRAPQLPVAIVGLNPLVLIWGLGGQHNDALMMFAVTGAVLLVMLGREGLGGAAAVTAVAIKASAGLFLPVLLVGAARRGRAFLGAATAAVVLTAIAYAAFGAHIPDIADQSKVVAPIALPNLLGLLMGFGGVTDTMRTVLEAGLAAVVLVACIQVWRGRELTRWLGVTALAALLTLTWVLPWYVLWLLPFAALSRSRALKGAALIMSAWLIFSWVPLMPTAIHSIGLYPSHTSLGHQHQRFVDGLLR